MKEEIALAIETGIGGGSISLIDSGRELDFWIGNNSVSKSEDVLPAISEMLQRNNINKKQIRRLIISEKPGSLTGLRIGMATILGLGDSLQAEITVVSALSAMRVLSDIKEVITAVPYGRDKVAWMDFDDEIAIEYFDTTRNFEAFSLDKNEKTFVVHQDLNEYFSILKHKNIIDAGKNTASHLGKYYLCASDNEIE